MKKSSLIIALAAVAASSFISSCASMDPEYAAYKKQQAAKKAAAANPFEAPALGNNDYAVPGANGETGAANSAPYQPLPGVADAPNIAAPDPAPHIGTPTLPAPTASAGSHTVIAGESLWRISRKYHVSVAQLKAANNLQNDTIWVGQKLIIPAP